MITITCVHSRSNVCVCACVCVCVCMCVCVTAARKTTYKVYVAAVNGAGRGEWEETRDPVSTKGLTSEYIQ